MSKEFRVVDIAMVRPNPNNIREDLGDLEQLAKESKTIGILTPLAVYPHPELEGDFMVKDGHRRLGAAIKAGLSSVPVVIEERSARGAVADVEAMLSTGLSHRLLNKLEEAKGYQLLLDLGQNESTVGKKLLRPKSEVLALGRVAKAPEKVRQAYSHGRLDLLAVKKLTDLEAAGQTGVLSKVLESRDFDNRFGWSIDDVDHKIAQAEVCQAVDETVNRLSAMGGVLRQDQRDENFDLVDAAEFTDEEHIAAGHLFYVGTDQLDPVWYVKLSKPKPKISDKEKRDKATLRALNAGLQVSYAVRSQAVVSQIQSKDGVSEAMDKELLLEMLLPDIMKFKDETLVELTGISKPEGIPDYGKERWEWRGRVEAALSKLSWRQLARAAVYAKHEDTDRQLRFAKAFDRSVYEWPSRQRWLNRVQSHFGYRLDQSERESLEFFKGRGKDRVNINPHDGSAEEASADVVVLDD